MSGNSRQLEAFDRMYAGLRAAVAENLAGEPGEEKPYAGYCEEQCNGTIAEENVRLNAENWSLVTSLGTANDVIAEWRMAAKTLTSELASYRAAEPMHRAVGKESLRLKAELDRYRAAEKARAVDPVDIGTLLDEFRRTLLVRWDAAVIDLASADDEWKGAREAIVEVWQARPPGFDLSDYIGSQAMWSSMTFGPGLRTNGILEHIRKELDEIAAIPTDVFEWIDVVILALDGAWRAGHDPAAIVDALETKQKKNFARKWPEPTSQDVAVEHVEPEPEPELPPLSEEMSELMGAACRYDPRKGSTDEIDDLRTAIRRLESNQIDPKATCGDCWLLTATNPQDFTPGWQCRKRDCSTHPITPACVLIERKPKEKTNETD